MKRLHIITILSFISKNVIALSLNNYSLITLSTMENNNKNSVIIEELINNSTFFENQQTWFLPNNTTNLKYSCISDNVSHLQCINQNCNDIFIICKNNSHIVNSKLLENGNIKMELTNTSELNTTLLNNSIYQENINTTWYFKNNVLVRNILNKSNQIFHLPKQNFTWKDIAGTYENNMLSIYITNGYYIYKNTYNYLIKNISFQVIGKNLKNYRIQSLVIRNTYIPNYINKQLPTVSIKPYVIIFPYENKINLNLDAKYKLFNNNETFINETSLNETITNETFTNETFTNETNLSLPNYSRIYLLFIFLGIFVILICKIKIKKKAFLISNIKQKIHADFDKYISKDSKFIV
jgi:hypothetical protein